MSLSDGNILSVHQFSEAPPAQVTTPCTQDLTLEVAQFKPDLFVGLHNTALSQDPILVAGKCGLQDQAGHCT